MKYILITDTFKRQLKKFRRHFSLEDVLNDLKAFALQGTKPGETLLGNETVEEIPLQIAKLRLKVFSIHARYLVGITENERDYLPFIIDLKTGRLGKNLSLESKEEVKKAIYSNLKKVISDYKTHTTDHPKMTVYQFDDQ